jgi:hypothetical protein
MPTIVCACKVLEGMKFGDLQKFSPAMFFVPEGERVRRTIFVIRAPNYRHSTIGLL